MKALLSSTALTGLLLVAPFAAAAARGELEIHPGVHHGFAFPQRWCYDKLAAERHWQRLLALYRRNL